MNESIVNPDTRPSYPNSEANEFLSSTLERIDGWLKFAEGKNAVLLGFSAGTLSFLSEKFCGELSSLSCALVDVGIFLLVYSSLMALISFMPIYNWRAFLGVMLDTNTKFYGEATDHDNLIFYGDIAKYERDQYLEALESRYFPSAPGLRSHLKTKDLASQIIVNSRIAVLKYRYFERGAVSLVVAFVVSLLAYILGP